jgi:glutaredoxin
MNLGRVSLGLLLLAASAAQAQTMYRWIDRDGRVVYSDQIPPRDARDVQEVRAARTGTIETGPSFSLKKAQQDFPVTFYRAAECDAACADAKAVLNRRGIPFSEVALNTEEDHEAFRKAFASQEVAVPSILVGSLKQIGFEAGIWNRMLDEAGYPPAGAATAGAGAPPAAAR